MRRFVLATALVATALVGTAAPAAAAGLPPDVPTDLTLNGQPCGPDLVHSDLVTGPLLSAVMSDPDGSEVVADFALWPVDDPEARATTSALPVPSGQRATVEVPRDLPQQGQFYEWTVRGRWDDGQSEWAPPCRFLVEDVAPRAPVVWSVDYPDDGAPHGGVGVPGRFTFESNFTRDVVGYWCNGSFFPADHEGGTATITITPAESGPHTLAVTSVDAAGHASPETAYRFVVG